MNDYNEDSLTTEHLKDIDQVRHSKLGEHVLLQDGKYYIVIEKTSNSAKLRPVT
jgi:hypothetical protein